MQNKLNKAKYKLLKDYKYFYIILGKFNCVITKCNNNCEGYVKFGKNGNLLKNTIYLNEMFLNKENYDHTHLIFTLVHELLHILLLHGKRQNDRIFELWHIAVNHCTDRECKKIFKNDIFPYELSYGIIEDLHNELPECSAEEAYEWLKQNSETCLIICVNKERTQINISDNHNNNWEIYPTEYADNDLNNFKSQSITAYEAMKELGNIPGHISEVLDTFMKIETPWDELLKKSIKTNAIKIPGGRSWKKLNPYYRHLNISLPSKKRIDKFNKTGYLYITIDTSMSMSNDDLAKLGYIIYESGIYYSKVTVFAHDVIVHDVFEFKVPDDFKKYIETDGYKGRGGTSHEDVFNKIEEFVKDDVNNLSMILCLTDGVSDAHLIYEDYWFTRNIPIMFLISGKWSYKFKYNNIGLINIY